MKTHQHAGAMVGLSTVKSLESNNAFVTFERKEDADTAQDSMDGQTIFGQQLKVSVLVK